MKILVTVKRIPDPVEPPKLAGGQLDTSSTKWVGNEFDEYAIETALRLAEVGGGTERLAEVVVLSVCPAAKKTSTWRRWCRPARCRTTLATT